MTENRTVGRPAKYDEITKVIAFRVPMSCEDNIKELVSKYLLKLEK